MFKKIVMKLVGKKIQETTGGFDGKSKTKIIAVIGVVVFAVESLSQAWGSPIKIPSAIFELLAMAGFWTLRDAIK